MKILSIKHGMLMRAAMLCFTLLCFSASSLMAALNIHQWPASHRGYSIEEIPGSNPIEYVAVGTFTLVVTWDSHLGTLCD